MEMGSQRLLFSVSLILIYSVSHTISQPTPIVHSCGYNGNYTSNSVYQTNLNTALSSLSSTTTTTTAYGFLTASAGQDSDIVNALALCRGDVELDICRSCVNDSISKLREVCPNQKEAIGWYEYCILRYSNRFIFHYVETLPTRYLSKPNIVTNLNQFNQALRSLMDTLKGQAAGGDSFRKFATGNTTGPDFQTIYALTQCTPDLSNTQCYDCLDGAIAQIPSCCNGKIGGRVLSPSCIIRYEIGPFYNDTPADAAPPPRPLPRRTVISIVVPSIAFVILFSIFTCIFIRKRKQRKPKVMEEISSAKSLQYDFSTIEMATDHFSDNNKLGQGGFGAVYKGRLQNGLEVAVKRLSRGSNQGDLEFKNEVMLVAQLQHRNLVRLLGFCLEGIERLLIYEFVLNASLDQFIFVNRSYLDWERRCKIIGGVARGLLYLHEDSRLRIIHRNLKASNVLLDAEMNPKISDFGMARLFELDETQGNTSKIVGTYGYMAPEYEIHGLFSVKSDIFSFGILVLEIVSGQKNSSRIDNNFEDLASYAWKNWRDGTTSNVIDPTLRASSSSIREMTRCIHIGLLCVQENIVERPTLASIVLMLNRFSLTLPVPSEPAFVMRSSIGLTMPSIGDYSSGTSGSVKMKPKDDDISANESITELNPR